MALTGNFTGSALGYGLINLPGHTGDVVRLRRSSDNAESDFTGGELVDGTALTWVGANNAFVVTIYDQTGGGFDMTQATSGSQTQIATSGAWIVTQNGLPGIRFDGTGSYAATDGNYGLTDAIYTIQVVETDNTSSNMHLLRHNLGTGDQRSWLLRYISGNYLSQFSTDGTNTGSTQNTATFGAFTHSQVYIREDQIDASEATASNTLKLWINGSVNSQTSFSGTAASTTIHDSTDTIRLGGGDNSQLYLGDWFLSVAFADNKVADRADIYEEVRQYYYGDPLLLDTHPDATRAYALHKLRSTYQGSCIRVRRSNDNAEADIGFDGVDLDLTALTTHVGANSGYIVTWYDQTGNANATQSTTANQPRIVNSGTVETADGATAMYFDGSNDYFTFTSLSTNTDWTSFVVQKRVASGGRGIIVGFTTSSNAPYSAVIGTTNQIFISTAPSTSANASRYRASTATNYDTTPALRIIEGYNNALTLSAYFDGSSVAMNAQTSGTASVAAWSTIGRVSSFYDNAYASAIILWTSDKTADRADIYSNLESYYFPSADTPVTLVGQDSVSEQGSISITTINNEEVVLAGQDSVSEQGSISITTQGNEDVVLIGQDSVSEQGSLALVTNTNNALTLVGQDSVSEQESVELAIIPAPIYPSYSVKPIMHSKSRGLIYVINEEDVLSLYIDRGTRKVRTLSSIYSDSTLSAPTLLTAYEDDDHLFVELQEAGLNGITFQTLSYDLADESLSIVSTNEKLFTNSGAELAENVIPNSTNGITAVGTGSDYIAFTSTEKPSFVSGDEYVEALAQDIVDASLSGYEPLQYWEESQSTSGVNATVHASVFKAKGSSTNVDAVFNPKGTGAILAQLPDGTSTGGNKRGANAVDLQKLRDNANEVAEAGASGIFSGLANRINSSGFYSAILGGRKNLISNIYSFIGGGWGNSVSGEYAGILVGKDSSVSGNYATAQGLEAVADKRAARVFANGKIVSAGDNQVEEYILKGVTNGVETITLTLDGASPNGTNQILANPYTVVSFDIQAHGFRSQLDHRAVFIAGSCIRWSGDLERNSTYLYKRLIDDDDYIFLDFDDSGTPVYININVTGEETQQHWTAYVRLVRTIFEY